MRRPMGSPTRTSARGTAPTAVWGNQTWSSTWTWGWHDTQRNRASYDPFDGSAFWGSGYWVTDFWLRW